MASSLRDDHIYRLRIVLASWQDIRGRLAEKIAQTQLANRLGLGEGMAVPAFQSMARKADVCVEACEESIAALTYDDADPEYFTANLQLAEEAATAYQQMLDQLDQAESDGRRAFKDRYGK